MKSVPGRFLEKIASRHFDSVAQREEFVRAVLSPRAYPEAIVWLKPRPEPFPFQCAPRLAWQPECVDRLEPGQKPGAHELHGQGAYYCLDFSSVFAAQSFSALESSPAVVVDLCAAPGGKSAIAWKVLAPRLLICNETIGKRLGALASNIRRCGLEPTIVTNRDPRELSPLVERGADLLIVDAPCSGQSLLIKGQESAGCFHPSTINLNKNRQRRIIAEGSKMVAPGGYLAYMTCTFSRDENEELAAWFIKKFPAFTVVAVPSLAEWQSHLVEFPCYRLWPQSGIGAGAFAVLFRNESEEQRIEIDLSALPISWCHPERLREESQPRGRRRG